jgi:ABC-type multidrug transport system ATPase subunit
MDDPSCAMPIVLRARALWKSYAAGVAGCSARVWVLRGASLDVERGECVAILGARGAGTTTLLQCLAGLRRPDAGSIDGEPGSLLVDSRDPEHQTVASARLRLVDDGLPVHRRPREGFARIGGDHVTTIIATHELARVRDVADRILLLHHGRLLALDHLTPARRVAEQPGVARVTDQTPATDAGGITASTHSGRRTSAVRAESRT